MKTLFWHDYETFGATPKHDRPSQFAGIRTDEDLNIIGDPVMIYCKPANDFIPHPMACKITGVTPQIAMQNGINENEFFKEIFKVLSEFGTCGVGYNSIAFDDEMTRYGLYRNLFDPYSREYANNCSRWDIMNMIRLVSIVYEDTLNWPINEKGFKSFRLEELSVANGIIHENAHDALSDVIATIDLAKMIKIRQPRLYDYCYNLRLKQEVSKVISSSIEKRQPLIHVSPMYGGEKSYFSIVYPICVGSRYQSLNNNDCILIDLSDDIFEWLDLPIEEIKNLLFSKTEILDSLGKKRPKINKIQINKCPTIVQYNVLNNEKLGFYNIDINNCIKNLNYLLENPEIALKLSTLFETEFEKDYDPDTSLYSGFIDKNDRFILDRLRQTNDFNSSFGSFVDNKFYELVFRYKARNYHDLLTDVELSKWEDFRLNRIKNGGSFSIDQFIEDSLVMIKEYPDSIDILKDIIVYVKSIGDIEIISKMEKLESMI